MGRPRNSRPQLTRDSLGRSVDGRDIRSRGGIMSHRRTAGSLLLVWVLAACASTGFLMAKPKVTLFGPAYPPRDSTAEIEVFQSQKPDRPYQEIARIEVGDTDDNWSMKQILIKAREIGADAVIIVGRSGAYGVGVPVGSGVYAASEEYGMVAIAIRFRR